MHNKSHFCRCTLILSTDVQRYWRVGSLAAVVALQGVDLGNVKDDNKLSSEHGW